MPSPLPSRSNNYQGALDTPLSVYLWNLVMGDVAARLAQAEAVRADFDELIAAGTGQALAVIQANVAPQLTALAQQVAALSADAATAQDIVEQINNGSIPASVVAETAARLWLTPTLRDNWNAKATPGQAQGMVDTAIAALKGGPLPPGLDTLVEIATALGNDPNALASLSAAVGARLTKAQNLADLADKPTARTNLGVPSSDQAQVNTLRVAKSHPLAEAADLNALDIGGWFDVLNPVNGPGAGWWWIESQCHNADPAGWRRQRATSFATGAVYHRVRSSGTWSAWRAQGVLVPIAKTTVSTPVAYVEHAVDFNEFMAAVTIAMNVSAESGGYHRATLHDAGGATLDTLQSSLAITYTNHTQSAILWGRDGFGAMGGIGSTSNISTAAKIRMFSAGGNLDSGTVATFGIVAP